MPAESATPVASEPIHITAHECKRLRQIMLQLTDAASNLEWNKLRRNKAHFSEFVKDTERLAMEAHAILSDAAFMEFDAATWEEGTFDAI
jgi:uncharacterized protein with NRDE domain